MRLGLVNIAALFYISFAFFAEFIIPPDTNGTELRKHHLYLNFPTLF